LKIFVSLFIFALFVCCSIKNLMAYIFRDNKAEQGTLGSAGLYFKRFNALRLYSLFNLLSFSSTAKTAKRSSPIYADTISRVGASAKNNKSLLALPRTNFFNLRLDLNSLLELYPLGIGLIVLSCILSIFFFSPHNPVIDSNSLRSKLASKQSVTPNSDFFVASKAEDFPRAKSADPYYVAKAPELLPPLIKLAQVSRQTKTYTVSTGTSFTALWKHFNVDATKGGSSKALSTLSSALKKYEVVAPLFSSGEKLKVTYIPGVDIFEIEKPISKDRAILLVGNSVDGYTAGIRIGDVTSEETLVSGKIRGTFSQVARENNMPSSLVDKVVDLFSSRINFERLHNGDSFAVKYEKLISSSGSVTVGDVKAATFIVSGKLLAAVKGVNHKNKEIYFDENSKPIGGYFLRYPVNFTRVSSVFSDARLHPVLGVRRPHNGVDFAAPIGTPVRTVGDGIVTFASYAGGGGKTVRIKHNGTYTTAYLHLNSISRGLRPGSRVTRGTVIGTVGMTGMATGPHLHFSLYKNGVYIDPLKVDFATLDSVPLLRNKSEVKTILAELKAVHLKS
jgi:murein DD-endopeptidase MepM/ murein hydrolase activator NlpD